MDDPKRPIQDDPHQPRSKTEKTSKSWSPVKGNRGQRDAGAAHRGRLPEGNGGTGKPPYFPPHN